MKQHLIFGLINTANLIFPEIVEKYGEGREGGYLCVSSAWWNIPDFIIKLGNPDSQKIDKYIEFAQEKSHRLLQSVSQEHVLSSQSRDPDKNKWGGAIYCPYGKEYIILSFSGLPEAVDEMFVAQLAYRNSPRLISHDEYVEARNISLKPEIWY